MNAKQIGLSVVLGVFGAFTGYAIYQYGFVGFFQTELSNLPGAQVLADLTIALVMVLTWMVRDAREKGISVLPFVLLTLSLGSIGPLLYLIRREARVTESQVSVVRVAA